MLYGDRTDVHQPRPHRHGSPARRPGPNPCPHLRGDPVLDALDRVASTLRGLLDAPAIDDPEVALQRVRAHGRVAAVAAAARLRALADAQAIGAHDTDGAPSLNEWLINRAGQSRDDAGRDTTTAAMLGSLPQTADALADGKISLDHAATIARTARRRRLSEDPADLDALVGLAGRLGADEFRAEVRRRELAADAGQIRKDPTRQHALRRALLTEQADGMWRLTATCDQPGAEIIGTALSAFTRPDPADTPDEHQRDHGKRLYDALVDASKAALDAGTAPSCGGEKPHVGVIVNADTLLDPDDHTPGEATVTGPCSADMARRIACDASMYRLVYGPNSEILDIGRLSRDWTTAQRRAVVARDGHCRGPSCDRPAAWADIHHVAWWTRDSGPTAVDNGLLLCHHCHKLVPAPQRTNHRGRTTAGTHSGRTKGGSTHRFRFVTAASVNRPAAKRMAVAWGTCLPSLVRTRLARPST